MGVQIKPGTHSEAKILATLDARRTEWGIWGPAWTYCRTKGSQEQGGHDAANHDFFHWKLLYFECLESITTKRQTWKLAQKDYGLELNSVKDMPLEEQNLYFLLVYMNFRSWLEGNITGGFQKRFDLIKDFAIGTVEFAFSCFNTHGMAVFIDAATN